VAYTPVFEPADCPFRVPAGATVACGFVIVPEDRSGDPDDTVRLAVATYRSIAETPAPDPVIYLQGGPGGGSLEWSAGWYNSFVKPVLETRDFVFFDQRGTGLSEPDLDCWEVKLRVMQDFQEGFPEEIDVNRYIRTLMTCRDRLRMSGANLAAYTSTDSAADVRDIAVALGYEQVNLYGISYGTRLAQAVMRDHPEIVRSVVLDSVVPIDVSVYAEVSNDTALQVLFDGCKADPACNAAYPDLEAVFYDLVAQLGAEPIMVEVSNPLGEETFRVPVNGALFTTAAVEALNSTYTIALVPQAIYQVRDGNYENLAYALLIPLAAYDTLSLGMMISVECHEYVYTSTPEALDELIANFHLTEALGIMSLSGGDVFAVCDAWGAAPFDPRDGRPLVSDIPTLILAGEYDPTTPPLFGRRVGDTLSSSYYFEFPGHGHAPSAGNRCALGIALAFLDDPTAEPGGACIAEMEGPRFSVP
jgi:pimeloyl-ACP methyl ester carboxylesterase